jgi:hypothetical protein
MRGRKSTKTPEVIEEICLHIAQGGSLVEWCKGNDKPGYRTIATWLSEDPDFQQKYAYAREIQGDYYADQIANIARDCPADIAEIQRARLLIDTYKWKAGKLKPKVYGDRLALDQQGAVQVVVSYGETPRLALHQDAIEAEIVSEVVD